MRPALPTLIENHRAELLALGQRHGVAHLRLFGSMARGDATADSDVDLLVDPLPGTSALDLGALLMDVQDLLRRRVDIVTTRSLSPLIRQQVLDEARPL
jgi:predicted nucleotidyltransferase